MQLQSLEDTANITLVMQGGAVKKDIRTEG